MKNQQKEAPLEYYRGKYRSIDPYEASNRTGFVFNEQYSRFEMTALGHAIYIQWPELKLIPADEDNCPKALYGFEMTIVTARYIIIGADVPSHNNFLAFRELPWGDVYDPNFQGHIVRGLARSFAAKPDMFRKAAEKLGGVKVEAGDCAFELVFFASISCRIILWVPDDDFPPSAQILFSDNTSFAFDAEALVGVGSIIISALKEKAV